MNTNEQENPLVVRLREAKKCILAAVNTALKEQNLPCYLLEPIIAEVHTQVSAAAAREYEFAIQQATVKPEAQKVTKEGD